MYFQAIRINPDEIRHPIIQHILEFSVKWVFINFYTTYPLTLFLPICISAALQKLFKINANRIGVFFFKSAVSEDKLINIWLYYLLSINTF